MLDDRLGHRPRVRPRRARDAERAGRRPSCSTRSRRRWPRASSSRSPGARPLPLLARADPRDAVRGAGATRRVRLHRQIGEALEALDAHGPSGTWPSWPTTSRRPQAGRDIEKAVDYARRAGERAMALLAYEEGARLYQMALDALRRSETATTRARRAAPRSGRGAPARPATSTPGDVPRRGRARAPARRGDSLARAVLAFGGPGSSSGCTTTTSGRAPRGGARRCSAREDSVSARASWAGSPSASTSSETASAARAPRGRGGDGQAGRRPRDAHLRAQQPPRRVWGRSLEERLEVARELIRLRRSGRRQGALELGHQLRLVDLLELGDLRTAYREMEAQSGWPPSCASRSTSGTARCTGPCARSSGADATRPSSSREKLRIGERPARRVDDERRADLRRAARSGTPRPSSRPRRRRRVEKQPQVPRLALRRSPTLCRPRPRGRRATSSTPWPSTTSRPSPGRPCGYRHRRCSPRCARYARRRQARRAPLRPAAALRGPRTSSSAPAVVCAGSASRYLGTPRGLDGSQAEASSTSRRDPMTAAWAPRRGSRTPGSTTPRCCCAATRATRRRRRRCSAGPRHGRKTLGMKRADRARAARSSALQGIAGSHRREDVDRGVVSTVQRERPDLRPHAAPDGTVTVLFTRHRGFTAMTERLGDRARRRSCARTARIVRERSARTTGSR